MRIGLTYDLRADYLAAGYSEEETAEFDQPATIAALQSALETLGHQTDPIGNGRQLVQRLAAGERWDLVFNIAEGLHGLAREAQVPAILDLYQIPYTFSDPLVMALALHKGLTKAVVRAAGVPTADFALVERIEDVDRVDLPLPLFAKPVAEGTGKGITAASKIPDRQALRPSLGRAAGQVSPAGAGRDVSPRPRVHRGHCRDRSAGRSARQHGGSAPARRRGRGLFLREQGEVRGAVPLPPARPEEDEEARQAEAVALAAYRAVGCRDAGRVDLRSDAQGRPHFIEVNPLAGLHPQHSDLPILCTMKGIDYVALIGRILDSACRRIATK